MKRSIAWVILLSLLLSASCSAEQKVYHITRQAAKWIMANIDGCVTVDVRSPERFGEKHIPGAINIPVDRIKLGDLPELPDKDQIVIVYDAY